MQLRPLLITLASLTASLSHAQVRMGTDICTSWRDQADPVQHSLLTAFEERPSQPLLLGNPASLAREGGKEAALGWSQLVVPADNPFGDFKTAWSGVPGHASWVQPEGGWTWALGLAQLHNSRFQTPWMDENTPMQPEGTGVHFRFIDETVLWTGGAALAWTVPRAPRGFQALRLGAGLGLTRLEHRYETEITGTDELPASSFRISDTPKTLGMMGSLGVEGRLASRLPLLLGVDLHRSRPAEAGPYAQGRVPLTLTLSGQVDGDRWGDWSLSWAYADQGEVDPSPGPRKCAALTGTRAWGALRLAIGVEHAKTGGREGDLLLAGAAWRFEDWEISATLRDGRLSSADIDEATRINVGLRWRP